MEQHKSRIFAIMGASHMFSGLTDVQLDRVYRHSEIHSLDDAQILFNQGEAVDNFYLVLSGRVKLFLLSPDGNEKILSVEPAGHVFAEALMFKKDPHYPVSAGALQASEVLGIEAKNFKAMLWDSPETCFQLMTAMSMRLHSLVHEIDTLTLRSGTCRVASFFLNSLSGDTEEFELDMAKNLIASRLSVKPETFSRILANMKKQGVIRVDGNHITILDRDALQYISIV